MEVYWKWSSPPVGKGFQGHPELGPCRRIHVAMITVVQGVESVQDDRDMILFLEHFQRLLL